MKPMSDPLIDNPILNTDSYKFSHYRQLEPSIAYTSSYIEARDGGDFGAVLFFGLQAFLIDQFGRALTHDHIAAAEEFVTAHGLPFNRAGFEHIVDEWGGQWPVRIQALPEGTLVPTGVPMVQLENLDPALPWVTSFVETALLRGVWYPSTVATVSHNARRLILKYLSATCEDPDGEINFRLHDFGARGTTCREQAGLGGMAHLVNFDGSDTVDGAVFARRFYGADMAAYSIPAAEHSTITSWGEDREKEAFETMVDAFGNAGSLFAVVSDSYDLERAVKTYWARDLRAKVVESGSILVVRPDSGDPVQTPLDVLGWLGDAFGTRVNAKGYRVLDPSVRVIQGDGMTLDTIGLLLSALESAGWSAENVAFGMGGGLLQKVDRDTLRWAQKLNAIRTEDGDWQPRHKVVKTDPSKSSKPGRQKAVLAEGTLQSMLVDTESDGEDLLATVWEAGTLLTTATFDEVRSRARG